MGVITSAPRCNAMATRSVVPGGMPVGGTDRAVGGNGKICRKAVSSCFRVCCRIAFSRFPRGGGCCLTGVARVGANCCNCCRARVSCVSPMFGRRSTVLSRDVTFGKLRGEKKTLFASRDVGKRACALRVGRAATRLSRARREVVSVCSLSRSCFLCLLSLRGVTKDALRKNLNGVKLTRPLQICDGIRKKANVLNNGRRSRAAVALGGLSGGWLVVSALRRTPTL